MRWIIGDVHGMLRPLEAVLEVIAQRDAGAQLIFCGDYADRGPDTRGVVDALLSLTNARFVRGNHDDIMDLCLNGRSFATGPDLDGEPDARAVNDVKQMFLKEGLLETLTSYGGDRQELARANGEWPRVRAWIDEVLARVPESHRQFFRALPAVVEEDDFFVCHATWPADYVDQKGRMNSTLAGDAHLRHDVLWGRYVANQIKSKKAWTRTGYFGHTPTDNYLSTPSIIAVPGQIIRGEKCVLIDTGAFSSGGRLTAVCHDDGRLVQAGREGGIVT